MSFLLCVSRSFLSPPALRVGATPCQPVFVAYLLSHPSFAGMTCVIDSGMMAETRVVSGLGSIIVDKVRPSPDPVHRGPLQ